MPLDSRLVAEASELARTAHRHQVRKASGLPYFSHLEAVARILASHGYDDDVTLAAAYLHDLAEDQPEFVERMQREMPPEVVDVVAVLTEQKLDENGQKRPKAARFAGYVAGLCSASAAAIKAIPISCADRIHNTSSIVDDERNGRSPLMLLASRPGELLEQLRRLRAIYGPIVNAALLASFDSAARDLEDLIRCWLPGRATMIAAEAHLGQVDKGGEAYIFHPMRVAVSAATPAERIVALLHDVVEDSSVSLEQLAREGFDEDVLRALDHLTRRPAEDYDEFIERVARQRLATKVKLLDLADNSDLSRLKAPTEADFARLAKYQRATARLQAELARRCLFLELDAASRERVAALATLPVVKGHHVTLAYRVDPSDFSAEWVPGGYTPGSSVEIQATHLVQSELVQVLVVEISGTQQRPIDGGTLHLTVSRAPRARSRDANRLLEQGARVPVSLTLRGTVRWVDA
ncbi:MAG TPA: HD domain-containing protein [Polyangiaceae bacterium]|nr:HD domain-containing protein [Polyangiaceae bacterium]